MSSTATEKIRTGSKADTPSPSGEPDVTDKICVITGADSGLGFETAVHMARKNCIIVMCCRDLESADASRREIMKRAGVQDISRIRIVELELADLDDVDKFPTRYDREMGPELKDNPVEMLILNAGILDPQERGMSRQGFESQLAINVLGHFKLIAKLINRMRNAQRGRIVFVSSGLHVLSQGKIDFDDLNREKSYWGWFVYGETKFGTLLLRERLNRLLEQRGISNVIVVAAHPGVSDTKIFSHSLARWFTNIAAQAPDKSAKSFVVAAVDPKAQRNGYCGPRYVLYGDPAWGQLELPAVHDKDLQDRFWNVCEEMTKAGLESKITSL